jgi:hypothetical protein
MARSLYGASGAAQVVSMLGIPTTAPAQVFSARTGGSAVTDILSIAGAGLAGVVTPDATGQILFQGPDGYTDPLWLYFGSGPRWAVQPVDVNTQIAVKRTSLLAAEKAAPSGTTTHTGLPYTSGTIGADQMAELDEMVIPRVANEAALSAAFASPSDGDRAYQLDVHHERVYSSALSRWVTRGTLISEQQLANSTTNSISFNSIPQTFKHLMITYSAQCASAGNAAFEGMRIQFNGDSGANYRTQKANSLRYKTISGTTTYGINDAGTGGTTIASSNVTWADLLGEFTDGDTAGDVGYIPGTLCASTSRGGGVILIPNYTDTTGIKSFRTEAGWVAPAALPTTDTYGCRSTPIGTWNTASAITSILVFAQASGLYRTGSFFSLYGIS